MNKTVPEFYEYEKYCELHNDLYIQKRLPCPYPNCVNGVDSDRFNLIYNYKLIKNELVIKKHSYIRKHFKGINGNDKYIWLNEKDFYPSLHDIIFNEVFIINKVNTNKTIYHYTNLKNLFSILESNELWLTQYDSLEDKEEILHGFKLYDSFNNNNVCLLDNLSSKDLTFFISCFSYDSNNKYLFKNYADNFKGIAIEFYIKPEFWFSDAQFMNLMPVIYDDNTKKKIINYCNYLFDLSKKWICQSDNNRINMLTESYKNIMEELVSFFKKTSYKEEKEVRWLYKKDQKFIKEYWGKVLKVRERKSIDKKYYTSTDVARNLCPFEDKIDLKLPIKSITLGKNIPDKSETINKIRSICDEYSINLIEINVQDENNT